MITSILVPLDGSDLAERALPYVRFLVAATGAVVTVIQSDDRWAERSASPVSSAEALGEASDYLRGVVAKLATESVRAQLSVATGPAANSIQRAAVEQHSDLIAMSTHGRSGLGRWAYGSVTEQVLRITHLPVLVVPAHGAS